jgi:hypothetical protein
MAMKLDDVDRKPTMSVGEEEKNISKLNERKGWWKQI